MPEFGACGSGFAINDPEVDWMTRAYAAPRSAYFVVEREGVVEGGGGVAPLEGGDATSANCARCISCPRCAASARAPK
jgi:putative acetyltransferase